MQQETVQKVEEARPQALTQAIRGRMTLALVIVAGFLDVVDFSIVQVALPTIRTELVVSLTESQWIIGAYGLTLAGFLMLSGRAGDVYGQKKLFVFGIVLFTIASLAGGLAPSFLPLVIARGVQGVGAAISTVTAFAILISCFPEGKERNRALGIFISVLSAGFAAGSILGGVLTATLGWRSIMFVNVPIGAVGAILSQKFLADNPGRSTERHLDLPGAVSLTGGLILFVYALTIASIDGFTSIDTLVPLGLSGLILAGFLAIENRSRAPLIPLSFLRRGNVLSANAMGLIFTSSAGGLTFLLTVFLQQILNFSAPAAGIAFLPPALIFFFVGGWGSSWLTNRIGMKPVLILSMALVTIGSALLIPITVAGGYFGILPGLIVWSLGASIGFVALSIAAVAGTQRGEEGLASGLINTSERIGFPLGLAVLLTIATITDPTPVGASGPSLASLLIGFQYAFLAATVLNGIGLLIALLIKNEKATNQY
ncbi:MFS transporter [Candidatus Bathyarchaeota archaeon]|nr:MAG: MFS transporter [Candidatus Bathyarchaeota archaeon]